MSDDSGVQFLTARSRKRPHHQMSGSSHNHSQSPGPRQGEPSSSRAPRSRSPRSNLPPMRYIGDGLDLRYPAMSSSQQEPVIDLTNESDSSPQYARRRRRTPGGTAPHVPRPPHFERNILSEPDVVDLVDEPDPVGNWDQAPPTSPEVQFVRATSRPRPRLPPPPRPRQMSRSNLFNLMRRSAEMFPTQWLPLEWDLETIIIGERGRPDIDVTLDLSVPFAPEPAPPPRSTYKPPSPAPEGFTRSAREDEIVVCPNCEMELGTGDEEKQQTWVAKQCGHVYCGECTKNRSLSKSKKSQKTKPFSKCQVIDCGKSVSSPRSMIQIYL